MQLSKPAITRLARQAGVKSISDECFPVVRELIAKKLETVLKSVLIVNSEKQTRTLMVSDIYDAFELQNEYPAQSEDLGTASILSNK